MIDHWLCKLLLFAVLIADINIVNGYKSEGEGQWGEEEMEEMVVGEELVVREEVMRIKREVRPQMEKKYRRLQHSITVQADIRSRYAETAWQV